MRCSFGHCSPVEMVRNKSNDICFYFNNILLAALILALVLLVVVMVHIIIIFTVYISQSGNFQNLYLLTDDATLDKVVVIKKEK